MITYVEFFLKIFKLPNTYMYIYYGYSSQPGPSRVAPPTPTSEDTTPLIPTDHSRTVANSHTPQQHGTAANLGEKFTRWMTE